MRASVVARVFRRIARSRNFDGRRRAGQLSSHFPTFSVVYVGARFIVHDFQSRNNRLRSYTRASKYVSWCALYIALEFLFSGSVGSVEIRRLRTVASLGNNWSSVHSRFGIFRKRLLVIPSWAVLRHGTGETIVFVRIRSAFRGRINLRVYRQALNSISISRRQRFAAAKGEKLSLFVDKLRASPRGRAQKWNGRSFSCKSSGTTTGRNFC